MSATFTPVTTTWSALTATTGAISIIWPCWASGSLMSFCMYSTSPVALNCCRRKMTSITNMSTIGTTFSSLFVDLCPRVILPPRIFDFSNRGAGRLPGVTMGMAALDPGDGHGEEPRADARVDDLHQVPVRNGVLRGDGHRGGVGVRALQRLQALAEPLEIEAD